MLKQGDADINMGADQPTTYDELGPDYVGTNLPADPVMNMFWINANVAPMDDINCRKALVMAADPAEMFKAANPHGPGVPATTLLRPLLGDKDTNQPSTNNIDGAKAAFEQCKYKDAMPKLYLAGVSGGQMEAGAQVLVEQWRQVLGITGYEFIAAFDKLTPADQAKVQFFRDDVGTRVFDVPSMLLGSIHSGSGNAKGKMGGYKNEQVDQLIDQALALPFDDPNRVALSLEAEKLATDEFLWIPFNVGAPLTHGMPWVLNLSKNIDWQVIEPWNLDIDLTKRP
jgi:peptide/nickel transport system substrate-binding protein